MGNGLRFTFLGTALAGLALALIALIHPAQAQGANGCRSQRVEIGTVNPGGTVTWTASYITCPSPACDEGFSCLPRKMGQTTHQGVLVDVVTCVCVQQAGGAGGGAGVVIVPPPPPVNAPATFAMYCDQGEYDNPATGAVASAGCLDTHECGGSGEDCEPGASVLVNGPIFLNGVMILGPGQVRKTTDGCDCS